MEKGKRKNPTNRNQDHSPSSERSTPTTPSPGHPNTTEYLDPDLKTFLMMMIEDIKKDFHKSLKEFQESTTKVTSPYSKTGKHIQAGNGNEQNNTRPKKGSRHNKENPK